MTSYGGGAVTPGTDLGQHARALQRVHDAVMGGTAPPARPRPLVSRSWRRVLGLGLDPTRCNARDPLPLAEVERRRHHSPLALVVDEIRSVLTSVADASRFIVVVTDADGVILWREGSAGVLRRADELGFSEGATWTEDHVGTNAIGTALAEQAPVQLFSAEHFEEGQHPWYCTASPVHDPRTGSLLGIVDVSGPALTLHPALVALVETATKLAEARLWRHHEQSLQRLRRSAEHVLASTSGPLLLVDDDGWVAHYSGVLVRDRIAAPRPDRVLTVPGLGLCLPERLGEGWLVRPDRREETLVARLTTVGGDAVLEVSGTGEGGAGWRASLTPRHAAVLRALAAAGPEGLTAAALSRVLFGDDQHVVTVRAEVSRLRRTVGALVAASPYRVADGVRLVVEQ
ncbi:GAF domain-containing protein [Lapillicoccus jejuensis]|uniref:GAF domain-containing protein n=1 Tax=Lapillicoccus jejuensis TaxID=402171 RepID=A0A542E482_9MICO|nr:GAF domain-containing protein [Lapillicoccus jejuensis]TQJ10141.1 GAF domain-containing protein [Lapillicoccus jejuensis]